MTGDEVEVWRMTRILFGATTSPFILAATIRHHLAGVGAALSDTAKVLEKCLYVDDLIMGVDSAQEATTFYKKARQIMSSAGIKLRKWSSNRDTLQQRFTSDGVENPCRAGEAATSEITPVLGLEWNRESDVLRYPLRTVLELVTVNRNTKRFVLQASARIFDPLGLLGPVTITAKMLFQELWTLGLEWDALLPPGVSERWEKWIDNLHHLTAITLPRRYACQMEAAELHIFTDASARAYGAVAYLRGERDGKTTVNLILAKTRVAPLKTQSLPRLELLGIVLGARMCANLRETLGQGLSKVTLCTDSMIALHWIRGSATQ
ncbi:hypothetical protein MTO96_005138 [Rhipicephalus appendiculatus]